MSGNAFSRKERIYTNPNTIMALSNWQRDYAADLYNEHLRSGNIEALDPILELAERDAELSDIIVATNRRYIREEFPETWAEMQEPGYYEESYRRVMKVVDERLGRPSFRLVQPSRMSRLVDWLMGLLPRKATAYQAPTQPADPKVGHFR